MESSRESGPMADQLLDELVPGDLDWKRIVCSYPIPALALAAVGGFLLGRSRGAALVAAVSTFAADQVTRNVEHLLGDEAS
jgi:hypothetical protein